MSKSNNFSVLFKKLNAILNLIPERCHVRVDIYNDFVLPKDWGFKDRVNLNFHIAFVKNGEGSYIFDNYEENMEKGKLYFVSSDSCHSRNLNPSNLPRLALIRFSFIDNTSLKPVLLETEPFAFAYIPRDRSKFQMLFDNLTACYENSHEGLNIKICGIVITQILFEILIDLNALWKPLLIDKRLEKAAKYLEDNLCKTIDIHNLAKLSGLTKNYFRQLFKRQYGMNPKEYHIQMKIRYAYHLLLETGCMIKDIADMLGYKDQYAFSKQFKSLIGKSPAFLKEQFNNQN